MHLCGSYKSNAVQKDGKKSLAEEQKKSTVQQPVPAFAQLGYPGLAGSPFCLPNRAKAFSLQVSSE